MMASIDIDQLAVSVMRNLELYAGATTDIVEKAVKETAKETAAELKVTSPVGDTGEYSKHWKYKRDSSKRGKRRFDMVVYSEKPEYRLTHLLEKGHDLIVKGRFIKKVKGYPHIKNAEENAEKRLINKILQGIRGIT